MTQLEEIQRFISSPAFDVLTDDAKDELRHIEQELKSQDYDEECEELILVLKKSLKTEKSQIIMKRSGAIIML